MSEEQFPEVVMPQCPAEKLLQGQKALVTGSSSGIGKAVAIALGNAGADVVVNYSHGEDKANEVVEEIRKAGGKAYVHQADVSNESQVWLASDYADYITGVSLPGLCNRRLAEGSNQTRVGKKASLSKLHGHMLVRQTPT
jgi:hypothetical protein